jgi:ubiquinone/menaquinone biosynthesis C-methylase UbiE
LAADGVETTRLTGEQMEARIDLMPPATNPIEADEYVLGTHEAELLRLGLQHRLWSGQTFRFWERAGIGPGKTVLDLGCGPGYTSLDLAELVAPGGRVVAVDVSERFVAHLRERQAALGITNVESHVMDIHQLEVSGGVDIVYLRWVLCFVSSPETAIERIAKVLRPGGVLAVQEYANYATQTLIPESKAFQRVVQAIMESWHARGGDPDIGLRLAGMMMKNGFRVDDIRPLHRIARATSPLWLWPTTFMRSFVPTLVERGLLTRADQQAFEQDWSAHSTDETALYWAPPIVEIIAQKL